MSSPRYDWWPYVKGMIRRYPQLVAEELALREPPTTASLSGMPGGGKISDPTPQAALRELPAIKKRELEAVRDAVEETRELTGGAARLKLVKLVFWAKTHTVMGAAAKCCISDRTARRYHQEFIMSVAKYFGLLDGVEKR